MPMTPMTPDELEAHGYPRDFHTRKYALPSLADSQEAMEGIGPDGEIRSSSPSASEITEAIDGLVDATNHWRETEEHSTDQKETDEAWGGYRASRSRLESLYLEQLQEIERLNAIHELVADEILFCHRSGGFITSDDDKSSLGYSVFCSDTFVLACADAEPITPDEAVVLHGIMQRRPEGISQHQIAVVWVAWKRGLTAKDFAYDVDLKSFPQEAFDFALRALSTKSTAEE